MAQHGLSHFEIGNHTVTHGADGNDIPRGTAQHVLGFHPHCQHAVFGAVVRTNGNHGRLAENNTLTFDINQRIGRTQVDGQIAGKDTQNGIDKIHAASIQ